MAADPLDQVLRLVAEGRLTADEAAPILAALDERPTGPAPGPAGGDADRASGATSAQGHPPSRARPLSRAAPPTGRSASRSASTAGPSSTCACRSRSASPLDRIPGLSGEQVERIREALSSGMRGPIFEVDDDGENTVRIVVE